MEFLFNYKIVIALIWRLSVMLKVFIYHFIGNVACTPSSITYRLKESTIIALTQPRKFLLNPPRIPTFQPIYQVADRSRR